MRRRDLPTFILYAMGFLLLCEWLRPVEQLTNTAHMNVFLVFMLLSFLLFFFRVRLRWQLLINAGYALFFLYHFFYQNDSGGLKWWNYLLIDLKENVGFLMDRNWDKLSNGFRTLLFFILLWLMVYLIHYWLLKRRRIFIFFFMTVMYISILDSFTPYSAKLAIVRIMVFGFLVMGMLTFYRLLEKEKIKFDPSFTKKWMIPLVAFIVFSAAIGLSAPKASPIWPDPVSYLQAVGHKDNGTGKGTGKSSRVGYGEDDSHLGGPFIGDKSVVYKIVASRKNYWKVETKDVYTGKGWVESGGGLDEFSSFNLVPITPIPDSVSKTNDSATIFSKIKNNYLIYPAGVQRILTYSNPDQTFEVDTNKEKIYSIDLKHDPFNLKTYQVYYSVPKYKSIDLQKMTDASGLNQEFLNQYTSLPKNLPPRIKQLAQNITQGQKNWFDKAKAIESYLQGPQFTYDQKKVAIPGKKDDYVDQFLFETKRGYCDNFSSTMAVMLRTLGIPTRWIKGFNSGEFIQNTGNNQQIYEITNNNAHSWVEVYFPTQGWVPFEPTKGFTNDVNISYMNNNQTSTPENQNTTPLPGVKKPQKPVQEEKDSQVGKTSKVGKNAWQRFQQFFKKNKIYFILLMIILCVMAILIYRKRGRWLPYYLVVRYRFTKEDKHLEKAYLVLLKQFERYGIKRKNNQSLRNFASYIDNFFTTREMTRLTSYYEQYLYNRTLPSGSWVEIRKLWENLIKKTIA